MTGRTMAVSLKLFLYWIQSQTTRVLARSASDWARAVTSGVNAACAPAESRSRPSARTSISTGDLDKSRPADAGQPEQFRCLLLVPGGEQVDAGHAGDLADGRDHLGGDPGAFRAQVFRGDPAQPAHHRLGDLHAGHLAGDEEVEHAGGADHADPGQDGAAV